LNAPSSPLSLAETLAAAVGLDRAPLATAPCGSPTELWARSGLATLTGHADAPPILPVRDYAGRLRTLIDTVEAFAVLVGVDLALDMNLYSGRAGEMGLGRRGRVSANGTARLLQTADGWLAVNLARPEDRDTVPAWIGSGFGDEPWAALEAAARTMSMAALAEAGQGLGIPAAVVGERDDEQWRVRRLQPLNIEHIPSSPLPFMGGRERRSPLANASGAYRAPALSTAPNEVRGRRGQVRAFPLALSDASLRPRHLSHEWERSNTTGATARRPLVVDLSSLWAGPLCGHLLTRAGARVVKVESTRRPDGARLGPPGFYADLHAGQESVALDFTNAECRAQLAHLIAHADVLIEGTRPRALEQLGVDIDAAFRAKPSLVWVSVTGYGRTGPWRNQVGFGDDAAAAGGLVAWDDAGAPVFVGDALADPVGGLMAAAGAFAALAAGGGFLVDVALREAAAFIADAPALRDAERGRIVGEAGDWRLAMDGAETPLAPPAHRAAAGPAAEMGAHTAAILAEIG